MPAVIDAHQHFWDLGRNRHPWLSDPEPIPFRYGDYTGLRRNYLPADFRRDTARHAIVGTVHMEAEAADPVAESDWLAGLAAAEGLPTACVGAATLDSEGVGAVLAAQAARPMVRGIRHKPRASAAPGLARRGEPGSMDCPAWRRGYALLGRHGMSFDLQTPWWHMDAAHALAQDFPGTLIVINHTGLPADRSEAGLAAWRAAMAGVARAPNVMLKISGLGVPDQPWTVEANGPIIRDAIAIFGPERCMFASNFPVDGLIADYDTILNGFLASIAGLPDRQQRMLLHDNAIRVYRLHIEGGTV